MRLACIAIAAGMLLLSSCAVTKPPATPSEVGPYTSFSGRLIVIEPKRRWQVVVQWDATPEKGLVRMTHAASNRIVQLSWQNGQMLLRDNADKSGLWRPVTIDQLAANGIIMAPQQLAGILTGHMPPSLIAKGGGVWEGKVDDAFLRIKWWQEKRRLELTDMTHGRKATLIIEP